MGILKPGPLGRKNKSASRREPKLFGENGKAGSRQKYHRGKPIAFRLFAWALMFFLWGLIALGGLTAYVWLTLDKQGLFQIPDREPGMIILASNGEVVAERGAFFGDEVRIDELPVYVPQAVIAIEDRRFYSHFGVDPIGLLRAAFANFHAGHVVEGGSTITQQLAKNLFLKPDRTIERKLQEMVLALWLEAKYSKDDILQLYLNRVYYGAGATGVEKAAQKYFRKSARDVTIAEAATLAAVLKAPSNYNPITHPEEARARAQEVINDMVEAGFITRTEAKRAIDTPAAVRAVDYVPSSQYIIDWIADQLPDLIGTVKQSIIVETTLDQNLQPIAEKSVRQRVLNEGAKLAVGQGAVVVLNMRGAVLAMVGGKSYIKSQFNRAISAKRQPGSSFKPFVYLTAMDQGMTPDSIEVDEPVRIGDWEPENYKRQYLGPVTLKKALALSLNTVAAKLAVQVGPQNVVSTAHRMGINSELTPNASIALGTSEVTLLEMTTAFTPFANGGRAVLPYVITRITTKDGQIVYERKGNGLGYVISNSSLGAMNLMMRGVVTEGTGRRAQIDGQDIAGKTGTSQDYRDAWFIGYSPYLICGVWVGNDDNSPTRKVTGGSIPAAIWKDIMDPAHRGLQYAALPGEFEANDQTDFAGNGGGGIVGVLRDMFGSLTRGQDYNDQNYAPDQSRTTHDNLRNLPGKKQR